jgi:hypothetical protein
MLDRVWLTAQSLLLPWSPRTLKNPIDAMIVEEAKTDILDRG